MNRNYSRLHLPAAFLAALIALNLGAAGFAAPASGAGRAPVVHIDDGVVRGLPLPGAGYAFRGLPYAAPPTGTLRWRAPQPRARWTGIRDATQFAPSCPQPQGL